jgi:hypothetical protein
MNTTRIPRTLPQGSPGGPFDITLDRKLFEMKNATDDVHSIVEDLVTAGALILYTRYIESQKIPYASRTLARELCLNASWASIPLDCRDITAETDDDLILPPIDEWAGGVLPVRNSDTSTLRCSVTPQREMRKTQTLYRSSLPAADQKDVRAAADRSRSAPTAVARAPARPARTRAPAQPIQTEAEKITKAFEEARKRTTAQMKAITVDSDFSVIPIAELKGLPPALIIPKVTAKAKAAPRVNAEAAGIRQPRPSVIKKEVKRRRQQPSLLAPDMPVFDEELASISYSDRFVCAPGVTFKDGSTVKSRPQVVNTTQMTRMQYDAYLEEMKKSGE